MAVVGIFAVMDRKLREFGPIVTEANDETVIRAIREAAAQAGSMLAKYPGDFDLWALGTYDTELGTVESRIRLILTVTEILNGAVAPEV